MYLKLFWTEPLVSPHCLSSAHTELAPDGRCKGSQEPFGALHETPPTPAISFQHPGAADRKLAKWVLRRIVTHPPLSPLSSSCPRRWLQTLQTPQVPVRGADIPTALRGLVLLFELHARPGVEPCSTLTQARPRSWVTRVSPRVPAPLALCRQPGLLSAGRSWGVRAGGSQSGNQSKMIRNALPSRRLTTVNALNNPTARYDFYYLHFPGQESEAQRGKGTYLPDGVGWNRTPAPRS